MTLFSHIDRLSANLFGSLTALRGKRIFHPRGVAYRGVIEWRPSSELPEAVLWRAGTRHSVVARLSWGTGFPEGWLDILGMAVRVVDVYGKDGHQDILMLSGGMGAVSRHLFWPVRSFMGQSFSTILPCRIAGKLYCFGTMSDENLPATSMSELRALAMKSQLVFTLSLGQVGRGGHEVGRLTLTEELSQEESTALTFNVWNTGADIQPVGMLNRLRRNIYKASQKARTRYH